MAEPPFKNPPSKEPSNLEELFEQYEREARPYSNSSDVIAALKELYASGDYFKDLVLKENPLVKLINPK